MSTQTLWLGALTDTSVTAVAKVGIDDPSCVLACRQVGTNTWVRSSGVASVGNIARMTVTGLTANTAYTCRVEPGSRPSVGLTGSFTTFPSGNASFKVAFAGDASEESNADVFDTIRTQSGARLFIHLGDMHYNNLAVNDRSIYRRFAYDQVFEQSKQSQLYRTIPTAYVWDDHDYGPNNSDSTAAGHDAACALYRERVPYYPLADAAINAHIGQSWVVGRLRFIMTDQRSAASTNASTDNSSKTMLGTAQKTWFKAQVSAAAAAGQAICWVCPRTWGGGAQANVDHWGGFSVERTELVDYIKTNAHGRVMVLSADMHALAIGSRDFATGGGETIQVFQSAPLDRTPDATIYGGGTYAQGWFGNTNGLWGTMQVTDSGGSTLSITWKGYNTAGSELTTHTFTVVCS